MQARVLLLLVFSAILFSGCVNVEYYHQFNSDGSSMIIQKTDLSGLIEIENQSSLSDQVSSVCQNITEPVKCSYEGNTITLSRQMKPDEGSYSFKKAIDFPYAIYTLEIKHLPAILDPNTPAGSLESGSTPYSDFEDPSATSAASAIKAAGANITYIVEMPGKIIDHNGELTTESPSGKEAVRFDIAQMMSEGKRPMVVSKEMDLILIAIVVFTIAIALGIVAAIIIFLKTRPSQ